MKKQLGSIAIVALLVGFTSCKSSSNAENTTTNRVEQTERRGQQQQGKKERPDAAQLLAEMDANKDGKLSKDEVKGPLAQDFSKIDTNDDDFISKEELENAPKPERGGGQGGGRPQGGRN